MSRREREAGGGSDVLDLLTMMVAVPAKEFQTLPCVERSADDVRDDHLGQLETFQHVGELLQHGLSGLEARNPVRERATGPRQGSVR